MKLFLNDISYIVPNSNQQDMLGCFIMNLLKGEKKEKDREEFIKIIDDFEDKGVDCIALACTDLQLLNPKHPRLNIFDTMKIFSDATVKELLNNDIK